MATKARPPMTPPAMAPALLPELELAAGVGVVAGKQVTVAHWSHDRLMTAHVSPGLQLHCGGLSGQETQRRNSERSEKDFRTGEGEIGQRVSKKRKQSTYHPERP